MTHLKICGRVDRDGALIAADPILYELQRKAGAALGEALAVPRIARLVSAATLTEQAVQGRVILGDEGRSIQAMVEVVPDAGGASISISDWQQGPAQSARSRTRDILRPTPMGWAWECNAALRLIAMHQGPQSFALPAEWHGRLIMEIFDLHRNDEGVFPLLDGRRKECDFKDQRISISADAAQDMRFSARVLRDGLGKFIGFKGIAEPYDETSAQVEAAGSMDGGLKELPFNQRIDVALRAPINRIIMSSDTLSEEKDGPLEDDYRRYAGDISHAGRHLLALVDDLADMHHIEHEDFQPAADEIDMKQLAKRAVDLLKMKAEEKNIRLHLQGPNDQISACGEFRRALQIVINILSNAIRYSSENTDIHLEIAQKGNLAIIAVSDQGDGIAAEKLEAIFEKFERLGRQGEGGSGLGLYIARRLARAMHGDLEVESEEGQGSTFTLTLPKPSSV